MGRYDEALVKALTVKDFGDLEKAHVKTYSKTTRSGKVVQVREHDDSRQKKAEEDTSSKTNMEVAKTILSQLGGNKFIAMTGAKNFTASSDALSFKLPSNFAKKGINGVRVVLNGSDTYDITFLKIKGTKVSIADTANNVYASDLNGVFKSKTGLNTHL